MQNQEILDKLSKVIRKFNDNHWCQGTGGNFSHLLSHDPFRLAISKSGFHKDETSPSSFLIINEEQMILEGEGKSSAETSLHLAVIKSSGAKCVLHTHTVWNNIISDLYGEDGGLFITGYEMLKGLAGITDHEHGEWVPIYENTQDIDSLAVDVTSDLASAPERHGFLLRNHGLYTWGNSLSEAKRHVEIFEFLFEVMCRRMQMGAIPVLPKSE